MSTGSVLPALRAAASSLSASRTESTESTALNNSAALAALLLCRCPIKCHSASCNSRRASALPANSCTRFSPKTRSSAATPPEYFRGKGLADCHQRNLFGIASRAPGGRYDPLLYARNVLRNRHKTETTKDTKVHEGESSLKISFLRAPLCPSWLRGVDLHLCNLTSNL